MIRFFFLIMLFTAPISAGWLDRKAEGWAWYEDEEERLQTANSTNSQNKQTALDKVEENRKQLELLLAEALLEPSKENILRYLEAQRLLMDQSAHFASQWGKVLLSNPSLDPTSTTYATTQYGRQLQKSIERERNEALIKSVATRYGLFFLYEGKSQTSKAFAIVVKAFSEKYQWPLIGIPVDGVELPEIKINAQSDLATKAKIDVFPALLAYDTEAQKIIPLAFGLKAMDQIENNVVVQFLDKE